jgi:hypothetical protein
MNRILRLKLLINEPLQVLILALFLALITTIEGLTEGLATNSDSLHLVNNIALTIENEIVLPNSYVKPIGIFPSKSQKIVREQIFALAELGPTYADQIYNVAMAKESETRTALIIALGLIKDDRVKDDVRAIVRSETNPYMKAYAVRSLSMYGDTLDIPLFLEAMADTNVVVVHEDVPTPEGSFYRKIGIVANEAVPALYKLGYKWEFDSINGGYKAVKLK